MSLSKMDAGRRASTIDDWQEYYHSRGDSNYSGSVDISDFRNLSYKILIDLIGKYIDGKESIIEVGAGDSDLLIDICQRFEPKEIYGLDYLESACERLSSKAEQAGVNMQVVCEDMFSPPHKLINRFDFVASYGVVEHFLDLTAAIRAIKQFMSDDGLMLTLIPNNKKTIYGWLMRHWNIDVYNTHVMYDIDDLKESHRQAGLEIVWCDYLVSSNFGMLSWCFKNRKSGINYWLYKQLTRISKLIWLIESKVGLLKPLRLLSPYIVCISRPMP